jgi:NAD(P)-dependent dehydrogenase (short-subunit alcohol dehydrogenase family)
VNLASTDGLRGLRNMGAYAAAKHGVIGLTRSAALEYADRNIRVNAIAPGPILSDRIAAVRRAASTHHDEVMREREPVNEGWAVASQKEISVEIDTELDAGLELEGRVFDLIRLLNEMRKHAELDLNGSHPRLAPRVALRLARTRRLDQERSVGGRDTARRRL